MNRIDYISDTIQNCKLLTDLSMSTNDLKRLPEAIGGLDSLITLKVDDNRLNELPLSIGKTCKRCQTCFFFCFLKIPSNCKVIKKS